MGTRRKLSIVVDAEYNGGQEITSAANSVERLGLESEIASQKQSAFAAKQKELARAVNAGEKAFDDAERELKQYGDELERGIGASNDAGFSLSSLAGKAAIVTAGIAAAGVAAQQAYQIIGEGADLIAAEQKFGNLAVSIDTTADALLGKMREATKGMVDDATLIAAGTDIMNLGLAKTEGGVVRMSAAVGALNLDMGVLALTLANDSTARLDSLGLSLEDVTKKKKELIASGFIGDAFDEAVLIALEEKMVLLGDASETTAGQMAIVEAQAANLTAEFKIMAATTAGPLISSLSTAVTGQNKLNEGIGAGVITTKEWNQIISESESIAEGQAIAIEVVNRRIGEQTAVTDKANKEAADYLLYQRAIAGELEDTTTAVTGLTLAQIYGAAAQEDANEAAKQSLRITAQNEAAAIADTEAREAATDAMKKQRAAIEEVRAANELARQAQEDYQSTLGDYFTTAVGVVGTSEDLTISSSAQAGAIYAAADAAGASATELALLGLATGDLSEAQAEAALKSAAMQAQIEQLGVAIAEGMDPTEALNRLEAFQAGLDTQDFTVRLGIEVEESTEKSKSKTDDTFDDFSAKAEEVTDDAKTFFSDFSEVTSLKMDDLGESFLGVNEEIVSAQTEARKLKDVIIDGLPDEKIIKIKIVTEGSIPSGLTGGGNTSATTTGVSQDIGH